MRVPLLPRPRSRKSGSPPASVGATHSTTSSPTFEPPQIILDWLRRLWSGWKRPLVLVTPKTVVAWHGAGFRLYWKWLSRAKRIGGRNRVRPQIRALIVRMATENPTWGAPRIHGELLKLGFRVSEPTVSRWLRQAPRNPDPAHGWLTFSNRDQQRRRNAMPGNGNRLAFAHSVQ